MLPSLRGLRSIFNKEFLMALNKAELIGHVGQDPEVRYLPDGTPTATVSIATTSRWKDSASGESKEKTEWHRVVFFRKLAEIVAEYIKKGSHVYVEGRLQTRQWEDKQGVKHYTTEIVANTLEMLDKKPASADDAPPASDVPSMSDIPPDDQPY